MWTSDKGTNVEVEYYFSAGVPDNTSARLTIATLNGAAFDQAYEGWADNQLNINKFEDGYVKGHISVDEAGLMFTSIPNVRAGLPMLMAERPIYRLLREHLSHWISRRETM